MKNTKKIVCSDCAVAKEERACSVLKGKGPSYCPTLIKKDLIDKSLEEYEIRDIKRFAQKASIQESECYADRDKKPFKKKCTKTRLEEIIGFAKKMGYKKLGLAFCVGLKNEAKVFTDLLKSKGFEVTSIICKAGSVPKERLGLSNKDKMRPGEYESMCNPIGQAKILNAVKTDFNIQLGLCVGHDSLFFKYSDAPVTVLAVKDRVLGHNPIAAIHNLNGYCEYIKR